MHALLLCFVFVGYCVLIPFSMSNQSYEDNLIGHIVWSFVYGTNGSILNSRDLYMHQCSKARKALTEIANEHQYRLRNKECNHTLHKDNNGNPFCPVCQPPF